MFWAQLDTDEWWSVRTSKIGFDDESLGKEMFSGRSLILDSGTSFSLIPFVDLMEIVKAFKETYDIDFEPAPNDNKLFTF